MYQARLSEIHVNDSSNDQQPQVAISAKNITVNFRSSEYKFSTFKEYVMQRLQGKTKFRNLTALDNVSIDVFKGEAIALIGHNGSGKSTLLKVLAGIIEPDDLRLHTEGRIAPMIELGTGFDPELSGLENIYLSCMLMGLNKGLIEERLEKIIQFAELQDFIDMPLKNYSSGMQARLGFACTTAIDPEILLVDEVLAVGDSNFAKKCLHRIEKLRAKGTTVVLVSHDPQTVRTFCSRAYVLSEGKVMFEGPVEKALEEHDRIMDQRYLASLPIEERSEIIRKRKLLKDATQLDPSKERPDAPTIIGNIHIIQAKRQTRVLELTKPFYFEVELAVRNPERFEEDITVGIAWLTEHNQRVGGTNNLQSALTINPEEAKKQNSIRVLFHFNDGLPQLCGGRYKIEVGVHDCNLTRTIYTEQLITFEAFNQTVGFNSDADIISLGAFLNKMEITWQPAQTELPG